MSCSVEYLSLFKIKISPLSCSFAAAKGAQPLLRKRSQFKTTNLQYFVYYLKEKTTTKT